MVAHSHWLKSLSTWCGLLCTSRFQEHGVKSDREGCGLVARYGRSLEISYRLDAACDAKVAVLRADGSKVVSLHAGDQARSLRVPVELSGGDYLVLVEGGNSRFVAPLHVAA